MKRRNKNGNTKIVILIILLIVVAFGIYLYNKNQAKAPTEESSSQNSTAVVSSSSNSSTFSATSTPKTASSTPAKPPEKTVQGTFTTGDEEMLAPDIQVWEVVYDGQSFNPKTIDIKVNDYVIFRNKSDRAFWPASGTHPTHNEYPEFDAKKEIPAGGKFEFQFTKVGSWSYHDHLNPSATGIVNVSE